jgi:hypothetical protein
MDVICKSCTGIFHETTEAFDMHSVWDGTMFRLRRVYGPDGFNWNSFPQDLAIRDADLCCPGCDSVYAPHTVELVGVSEPKVEHEEEAEETRAQRSQGGSKGKGKK